MSSISFKIQAFFVPQLQQPSFFIGCRQLAGKLFQRYAVDILIDHLIKAGPEGRVKHCSHMGHSLVSLPRQGMGATLPSMARRISPAV